MSFTCFNSVLLILILE
ncbi:hypothetical protein FWK35_00031656 [Aphis craccivora]|uniref:Uncharacterized protein n=1 Tax=Aphis craccivora TaxID=307492 RepID=A0A6G0YL78_APHCR|nr:hypothetical protein FWK35_00008067 [Aphis craccivora]KAF0760442.1 hypothetical protein FWK35_00031656 [Aphis craccivora]